MHVLCMFDDFETTCTLGMYFISSGVAGGGGAQGARALPLLMESLQIEAKLYRSTYLLKLVTYQFHVYKRATTTVLVHIRVTVQ